MNHFPNQFHVQEANPGFVPEPSSRVRRMYPYLNEQLTLQIKQEKLNRLRKGKMCEGGGGVKGQGIVKGTQASRIDNFNFARQ